MALLNAAEVDVSVAPHAEVQSKLDAAKVIFSTTRHVRLNCYCDVIWGDLLLREENTTEAEAVVQKVFRLGLGKWLNIVLYAPEILGDRSRWNTTGTSTWTTVFLARSLKSKQKLGTHKVLQFLGDAFASQNDENTAISLFTVALEGFTYLDVHRSRAECLLRFGDISERTGHLPRALEHWETARPLFQQSSQAKRVENIDRRLTNIDEDLKERYRNQLASAAELKSQDEEDKRKMICRKWKISNWMIEAV